MHYTINETRSRLTIHADPDDQEWLAEIKADDPDELGTSKSEGEILESLICNSELEWIDPADTGDLTDAPMLGIRGDDETILERWAFMSYQVRSFCDDLLTTGEAVFINGD
jgi:hypothetical protein